MLKAQRYPVKWCMLLLCFIITDKLQIQPFSLLVFFNNATTQVLGDYSPTFMTLLTLNCPLQLLSPNTVRLEEG